MMMTIISGNDSNHGDDSDKDIEEENDNESDDENDDEEDEDDDEDEEEESGEENKASQLGGEEADVEISTDSILIPPGKVSDLTVYRIILTWA